MKRRLKYLMILGLTLVASSSMADETALKAKAQAPAKSGIAAAEAKAIALRLVPGKMLEVEREKHKGEPVFSVEIRGADGVHEVIIRVADGTVIEDQKKGAHGDEDEDEDDE